MTEPVRRIIRVRYEDDHEDTATRDVNCVIYARYSTDHQSQYSSVEQIQAVNTAVDNGEVKSRLFPARKLKVIAERSDDAVSGASMAGRDGLQEVLAMVVSGTVKVVLVANFKRLSRGMSTAMSIYDILQKHGAELISVEDQFSSADGNGRLAFMNKAYAGEEQLHQISTDTTRALDHRRNNGLSDGHLYFGVGSKATRFLDAKGRANLSHFDYVVINHLADVVRQIFRMAADGFSLQEIARKLNVNKHQMPPPAHWDKEGKIRWKDKRGLEWRDRTIFSILNNKSYLGILERKKTKMVKSAHGNEKTSKALPKSQWIVVERPDLQIVPQELWDAVRARFRDYQTRKKASGVEGKVFKNTGYATHVLTGMFKCGECGDAIVVVSGRRGGYYGCQRASRLRSCENHKSINWKNLETPFFGWLIEQVVSDDFCREVAQRYNELRRARSSDENYDLAGKQARLTEVTTSVGNIVRAVEQGVAAPTLMTRLTELEREKDGLEHHIKLLKNIDPSMVFMTPAGIKAKMAALQLPKLLQSAEPYEIHRAIKPLLEGRTIKLELRDRTTKGPSWSTDPDKAYWLVGSIDLGRLLRSPASGVLSTPERVSAEVKVEMCLE